MSDGRKYYCLCDSNCKFETMTKEQILSAIAQAVETGSVGDCDAGFISKVKEKNGGNYVSLWVGTQAQYNSIATPEQNCLYIITDDTKGDELINTVSAEMERAIETANNAVITANECASDMANKISKPAAVADMNKMAGMFGYVQATDTLNHPLPSSFGLAVQQNLGNWKMQYIFYLARPGVIYSRAMQSGVWLDWARVTEKVSVAQDLKSGTKIGSISVNGTTTALYAPTASGGDSVKVTQELTSGTKIGSISVSGKNTNLYAPKAGMQCAYATELDSSAYNEIPKGIIGKFILIHLQKDYEGVVIWIPFSWWGMYGGMLGTKNVSVRYAEDNTIYLFGEKYDYANMYVYS